MKLLVHNVNFYNFSFRPPSLERRFLLWGFILPLTFDFKKIDETKGTYIQIILLCLALIFGGLYILLEEQSTKLTPYQSTLRRITLIWWLYLLLSPLPVYLWKVNIEHYLKVLLPFILFGVSLSVMCSIERRMIAPSVIINMLLWSGLLGSVWRVVYAIVIAGLKFETIRWQILHPSIPFLLGFGVAGIYLKKNIKLSSISLLTGISIAILSVTRSYIISIFLIFIGILALELRNRSLLSCVRRIIFVGASSTLLILAIAITITIHFRPNVLSVWTKRLTEHSAQNGLDLTLITRIAEIKGQMELLNQNYLTLFLGNGIGYSYEWDPSTLSELPFKIVSGLSWFGGHSSWIYTFFSSGLILGAIFPFLLVFVLKRGYDATSQHIKFSSKNRSVIPFLIFMSYFGQSFTTNLLDERYGALILGIVIGSIFLYGNRELGIKQKVDKIKAKSYSIEQYSRI